MQPAPNMASQSLFIRLFVRSFIHSLICSFVRSFVLSFIHSFIHSFDLRSCIYSFIHLFARSFVHSFIHSFIHLFIHACIHTVHSLYLFIHLSGYLFGLLTDLSRQQTKDLGRQVRLFNLTLSTRAKIPHKGALRFQSRACCEWILFLCKVFLLCMWFSWIIPALFFLRGDTTEKCSTWFNVKMRNERKVYSAGDLPETGTRN